MEILVLQYATIRPHLTIYPFNERWLLYMLSALTLKTALYAHNIFLYFFDSQAAIMSLNSINHHYL
jgi:hypothetical protein